jgi:hypothetical protein
MSLTVAPPTGDLERRVFADDADSGFRVCGVAVVNADIRSTVLVVDDTQKEELTAGQQHPVRRRILIGRHDRKSVAIPRDQWRWLAFGFAVESRRFILGDELVFGMFDNAWV